MSNLFARAPWSVILVVGLGIVPTGLGSASCASTQCTLVGCGDGLTLVFDETVPRDYTVTVTIDGTTDTVDCTAAAEPDTTVEYGSGLPQIGAGIVCKPNGLTFAISPKSLSIVIAFPDGVTTTVEATPEYEAYYPNGEDCDDEPCLRADYEIDIHPPSG